MTATGEGSWHRSLRNSSGLVLETSALRLRRFDELSGGSLHVRVVLIERIDVIQFL